MQAREGSARVARSRLAASPPPGGPARRAHHLLAPTHAHSTALGKMQPSVPSTSLSSSSSSSVAAAATRLLLTNLHPSVAAHHLRDHLHACPPTPPGITDLKVLSRPNGSSRCIAFAGFKSHDDADRVRRWAAGAWVAGDRGGARIKVDWAKDVRLPFSDSPARSDRSLTFPPLPLPLSASRRSSAHQASQTWGCPC